MDLEKTGQLLCRLRKERGMTQKQVADRLNISAKTVSKWECGGGFPDVSVLRELSGLLGVNSEQILSGSMEKNEEENGNMKRIKFYVCPSCGSIMTASGEAEISCCGRKLTAIEPKACDEKHCLNVETVENDFYITFNHEMTKEHYLNFVAYVGVDRMMLVRLYPEQGGEVRFPQMYGGKLYFGCNKHGLFEKI
ncbi:MAG: helix-turn-helix domain-containing protein [Hominilimicola sp.]